MALIKISDELRREIDRGNVVVMILYDFSSAFNNDHEKLFEILRGLNFGNEALRLLREYLVGRYMTIPGAPKGRYTCGVDQGAGPSGILFIIYICLVINVFLYMSVTMFADDIQGLIACRVCELPDTILKINADSCNLVDWAERMGLSINAAKTKAIVFGSTYNLKKIQGMNIPKVQVDHCIVDFENSVKNLGLIMTNDLSWRDHVNYMNLRVNRALHFMNSRCKAMPKNIRKTLVTSLIFPIIDYGCMSYNGITKVMNDKVDRWLNRGIRFIFRLHKYDHISPYRRELNWFTSPQRRLFFMLVIAYKILKELKPEYLYSCLEKEFYSCDRQTRQSKNKFSVADYRLHVYKNSFVYTISKAWDQLPDEIVSAESVNEFKNKLRKYIIDNPNMPNQMYI